MPEKFQNRYRDVVQCGDTRSGIARREDERSGIVRCGDERSDVEPSGCAAAMLDGLCDRMEEELGYSCRVIATGGLAGLVVEHCRRKVEYSDTLLLDGLKAIYDRAGNKEL